MPRQTGRGSACVRLACLAAASLLAGVAYVCLRAQPEDAVHQESIGIFSVLGADPKFLAQVPRGLLKPNGSAAIHLAHIQGLPHAGVYMVVRDRDSRLLLLQRGQQLKTCPGTWGFLGEHMQNGEDPEHAVRRALKEELGEQVLRAHGGSLFNISTVWYSQVYADGREERQVTHIWAVQLNEFAAKVVLHPDDEIAALKWVPEGEVRQMLLKEEGERDDGRTWLFCSEQIRAVMLYLLDRVDDLNEAGRFRGRPETLIPSYSLSPPQAREPPWVHAPQRERQREREREGN